MSPVGKNLNLIDEKFLLTCQKRVGVWTSASSAIPIALPKVDGAGGDAGVHIL